MAWGQSDDGRDGFRIRDTKDLGDARVLLVEVAVSVARGLDGVGEVGLEIGDGQGFGGRVCIVHVCDNQDVRLVAITVQEVLLAFQRQLALGIGSEKNEVTAVDNIVHGQIIQIQS